MTRTKSRGQRGQIVSHFKILNDFDSHPPSKDDVSNSTQRAQSFPYYKIDLSQFKLVNQASIEDHENKKSDAKGDATNDERYFLRRAEKDERIYPSVSHGTRNLLREVANIRRQYEDKTCKSGTMRKLCQFTLTFFFRENSVKTTHSILRCMLFSRNCFSTFSMHATVYCENCRNSFSQFFRKNFVKALVLLKKLLNS